MISGLIATDHPSATTSVHIRYTYTAFVILIRSDMSFGSRGGIAEYEAKIRERRERRRVDFSGIPH